MQLLGLISALAEALDPFGTPTPGGWRDQEAHNKRLVALARKTILEEEAHLAKSDEKSGLDNRREP